MTTNVNCTFCNLISTRSTEFSYEDDDYVAFKDIKPASICHYLIMPKQHVEHASVSNVDLDIIRKLKEIGKEVLKSNNMDLDESRFGFHLRPFYSVNHLHLHAIAPVSQMKYLSRLIFWPNSIWFMDIDTFISRRESEDLI